MPYNIYTKWCASSVAQSCPALCDPIDRICQAPLCMGFFRQEDWSGLPFLSPGDLPNPGVKSMSLHFLLGRRSLPLRYVGSPYYTASICKHIKIQIYINREEITGSIGIEKSINISTNIIPPYQEWHLCVVVLSTRETEGTWYLNQQLYLSLLSWFIRLNMLHTHTHTHTHTHKTFESLLFVRLCAR